MSAASVDLEIYQGEDYAAQIIWTDGFDNPLPLVTPAQMDIKSSTGTIVLQLDDTVPPEPDLPEIALAGDIGLIQIYIARGVTASLNPGNYSYDLFCTVDDAGAYAGTQAHPLIAGTVSVRRRVTEMTE